ncbi:MAG: 4-hydroxy-3-methylbut-2-enyl diphosphate reductase [Deltaproteobacteria bacterium]|nr:4-hydroxy-3-methylbut-2-enyl diphosphate reductase [Deltaproteobacteria bacterium]
MNKKKNTLPVYLQSSLVDQLIHNRPQSNSTEPITYLHPPFTFKLASSFGFCFGVKQALEKAYLALSENPGKKIYLLGEIIHNPLVNNDLKENGIEIFSINAAEQLITSLGTNPDPSIVIIPAFGAPKHIYDLLEKNNKQQLIVYDTTCPFVQKVWRRGESLSAAGYSLIIHAKPNHEETMATLSHCASASVIIRDKSDALAMAAFIKGHSSREEFDKHFLTLISPGFNPEKHLDKVGIINQTTMLASETQELTQIISDAFRERYGAEQLSDHFANTKDTLCYATNKNQQACLALANSGAQLAIVIGGYNSSNTSHLVDILSWHMPCYFIDSPKSIISRTLIKHYDCHAKTIKDTADWLEEGNVTIAISAGASCPDYLIEKVIKRICELA